jgi:hypothetical protein
MAEKRPVIHPLFSIKKTKEINTTEREEIIHLSPSNDETNDEVNTHEETTPGGTHRLNSYCIYKKVLSENSKTLKEFLPMGL